MGKWRRSEDDTDRVAEIKGPRVLFLSHMVPFHLICSLGSLLFFFLIYSSIYRCPGKKKRRKMEVVKVLCA